MPAPSERHDPQVEELAGEYEEAAAVATAILAAFAAGAATPQTLGLAREALQELLETLLVASVAWVGLNVPIVYRGGLEDATRAIFGPVDQDELRAQADEAMRRLEHREAVEALAETLRDDLENAVGGMARDAERTLADIRQANVRDALAKGSPLAQVERMAEGMRENGVGFTDRGGREWISESYGRMILRTHTAKILNAGHLNRALEMGSSYVRVFDGGPGDVDTPCVEANGQVWHVLFAAANTIEHPNCRRSFAALDPDFSGRVDREAEEARAS